MNPFKFGTIVEDQYFTDRISELAEVKQRLDSENHLVLISPRRFGKSSLVNKAVSQMHRPTITIDMMGVLSVDDFSVHLMRGIFKLYKFEKIKHLLSHFRVSPTISFNPMTNGWDVSFVPSVAKSSAILEDAMELLQKVTAPDNRLIVIIDEFQEITELGLPFTKQLRSLMQRQNGFNYILMGSQESMMNDIFEKKKSPFYHFGQRMSLAKVPYDDFFNYIVDRLPTTNGNNDTITTEILRFTSCHPYYTQQLASEVYNQIVYNSLSEDIVKLSVEKQVREHDLDYERLWITFKRTDRKILKSLALGENPLQDRSIPYTTSASAIKRLLKQGYLIKLGNYEIEDPFFRFWIAETSLHKV